MIEALAVPDLSLLLLNQLSFPRSLEVLQRFLDRYLHRARNRLNTIRLALYMARRSLGRDHADLAPMEAAYEDLQKFLEHFQRFTLPLELTLVEGPLERFLSTQVAEFQSRCMLDRERLPYIELDPDPRVRPRKFDPNRLGPALLEYLQSVAADPMRSDSIRLRTEHRGPDLIVTTSSESTSEPPPVPDQPTLASKLAIPWLARVVTAHGADFAYHPEPGIEWRIRWPS